MGCLEEVKVEGDGVLLHGGSKVAARLKNVVAIESGNGVEQSH